MLEPLMYTGGVYRHDELIELVEDLGGHVLQKNVMQLEVVLLILVPADDITVVEEEAKELLGTISSAPLIGTEIAVVAPSLAYHHMPHPTCDIAEYPVSYTHLRAHETRHDLVCRLLLEKKK